MSQPDAPIEDVCKVLGKLPRKVLDKLLGGSSGGGLGLRSLTNDADAMVADIVNPGRFSRPLSFYGNTG